MIAETRRAQATTSDFERELATNADKARERSRLLAEEIRTLGGAPDVTGMFVGRLAATTKAAVEQGQDIVEALLGVDMATVLDPTLPEVAVASERSRAILTELGAAPFLSRLDGLTGGASAATPASAEAPTAEASVQVPAE